MRRKANKQPVDEMCLARGFELLGGKGHGDDVKLFAFMQIFHPGRIKSVSEARALRKR